MKAYLLTILLFSTQLIFASSSDTSKTDNKFSKKSIVVSTGYGFVPFAISTLTSYSSEPKNVTYNAIGPIYGKIEIAISKHSSLSFCFAHLDLNAEWDEFYEENNQQKVNHIKGNAFTQSYNLRYNYHFVIKGKFDPYLGVGAGYRINTIKFEESNLGAHIFSWNLFGVHPSVTQTPAFELTFGTRYYLSNNIALYTEIGFAKSVIQAGISVKLR
jgi:opacity protein-like surface antigen